MIVVHLTDTADSVHDIAGKLRIALHFCAADGDVRWLSGLRGVFFLLNKNERLALGLDRI
mgnify:FL=1